MRPGLNWRCTMIGSRRDSLVHRDFLVFEYARIWFSAVCCCRRQCVCWCVQCSVLKRARQVGFLLQYHHSDTQNFTLHHSHSTIPPPSHTHRCHTHTNLTQSHPLSTIIIHLDPWSTIIPQPWVHERLWSGAYTKIPVTPLQHRRCVQHRFDSCLGFRTGEAHVGPWR